MKFEQVALVCTWVIDQLEKGSLELNFFYSFDSLQKLIQISFEFGFSPFRVWLNHLIGA
jgi:hypothetical protein